MKKIYFSLMILIILISCKAIKIKDKDTTGKVIFKNQLRKSENLKESSTSGLFKISGIEEIPPIHLKFDSETNFKEKTVFFRISTFKTPILDIFLKDKDFLIINHTGKEYTKVNIEHIDFSKLIGINFNPLDISYLFLGCIPYSETMELLDFKWSKREYIISISDNVSKYTVYLNKEEEILNVEILNQYFDKIYLESIRYKKDIKNNLVPSMLLFSNEDESIKMSFIINKSSTDPIKNSLLDYSILKKYKEVSSLDKINIDINNKSNE